MGAGIASPGLFVDVSVAADKVVLYVTQRWFLRERPGSQAIASTSCKTIHVSQDMYPEDRLVLFVSKLFCLAQVVAPVDTIFRDFGVSLCLSRRKHFFGSDG